MKPLDAVRKVKGEWRRTQRHMWLSKEVNYQNHAVQRALNRVAKLIRIKGKGGKP